MEQQKHFYQIKSFTLSLITFFLLSSQFSFSQTDFSYSFCSTGEYATLTGPKGFTGYQWSNGMTGQTITISKDQMDKPISCQMTCPMGCDKTLATTVFSNDFSPSSSSLRVQHPTCHESQDGSISLNVATQGAAPFKIKWSDGSSEKNRTGLNGGNYSVTITDQLGCQEVLNTKLHEPEILEANSVSIIGTDALCFGSSNGAAEIKVNNGSISDYSFQWNTGETNSSISNVEADTYTVRIKSKNKCRQEQVTIKQPTLITPSLQSIGGYNGFDISCPDAQNGIVKLNVTGGVGSYNIQWNQSEKNQKITQDSSLVFSELLADNYAVIVSDDNGCEVSSSITLKSPDPIKLYPDISQYGDFQISCRNLEDGFVKLNTQGGSGTYDFEWLKDGAVVSNQEDLESAGVGKYMVRITDNNECTSQAQFKLKQPRNFGAVREVIKKTDHYVKIKVKPQGAYAST